MKAVNKKTVARLSWLGLACFTLSSCGPASLMFRSPASFSVLPESPNKVCDPFGKDGSSASYENGIAGKLSYLPEGNRNFYHVDDLIENGIEVDADVILSRLNVPTRSFLDGFDIEGKGKAKDEKGNELVEYFSLDLFTELQLKDGQPEGDYEFALLSDDGATMKAYADANDNEGTMIVNNDGTHQSRFACGTNVIRMTKGKRVPIRVRYYQGPRYHIALMLLWRPVAGAKTETQCGADGNNLFFSYAVGKPSVSKPAFDKIVENGWTVPEAENFVLPGQRVNTCL